MTEQYDFEKQGLELEKEKLELELVKLKLENEQKKFNSGVPPKKINSFSIQQQTQVKCAKCETVLKFNTEHNDFSILIACPQCNQKMKVNLQSKSTTKPFFKYTTIVEKAQQLLRTFKAKPSFKFNSLLKYSVVAILFVGLLKFCNSIDLNSKSNYSTPTNSSADDIYSKDNSYTCPHCDGTGKRVNGVTGVYGSCSTCNGTGKVNKWGHDHYVKEYSTPSINSNSDNSYTCPRCGGLGQQTDITGDGMSQTTCSLCGGSGKVNQWTYEHFDN